MILILKTVSINLMMDIICNLEGINIKLTVAGRLRYGN